MKARIASLLVAVFATLAFAGTARAGDQDFTLVNKTGVTIDKVMVSPHEANHWGEDIMGKDVLADGESVLIKFHPAEEAEDWDLKIMDKEGTAITWGSLRLTKITKLTIKIVDGKPIAEVE
ncbi:MAG TPA: hypothetical protein VF796_13350 [Humisphaera sp.]